MSFAISVVNFNSIKVQLERPYPIYQDVSDAHFNSIKVQLEPSHSVSLETGKKFQFHKGTIRTVQC